jgi:hypothetical protein
MRKALVLLALAGAAFAALRRRRSDEPDLWKQATQAADLR